MFEGSSPGRRSSLPATTASGSLLQETGSSSGGSKGKRECFTFEPQQWRQSVCKNCFRTQPEHLVARGNNGAGNSPEITAISPAAAPAAAPAPKASPSAPAPAVKTPPGWVATPAPTRKAEQSSAQPPGRTRMATPQYTPANIPTTKENKTPSPREDRLGAAASGPPTGATGSRVMTRKAPAVSQRSLEDPRAFVGQRSAQTSAATATAAAGGASPQLIGSGGATGVYSSASSIDARYVEELENDFFDLEDKYDSLLRERNELSVELDSKMRSIDELQSLVEQYKEKASTLGARCTHLEEEIKTYRERLRLPESDQVEAGDLGSAKQAPVLSTLEGEGGGDLRQRLNEVEQLCQDVMEENEVLKEELEEMQREIEEMHDHFQEEDRDSMREMQRDLDTANKTVRIFQFKLRKAERRLEQCENERANLEERLARLESELYSETDVAHIRNLEDELRVAKEVSVRLNNELDALEEKRHFYENENQQLKDELQVCQNRRITSENELDRLRLELDKVKSKTGFSERGPLQVTDKKASRTGTSTCPSLSREPSLEEHELQRELQSTKEREADLSEQLRFAEEEIRKLTRRITEAQAESDVLSRQVERLNAAQGSGSRGSSPRSSTPFAKKGSEFQTPVQAGLKDQSGSESEILERRCTTGQEASVGSAPLSVKDEEELKVKQECLAESMKRLSQLSRDLLVLTSESKSHEWFSKYKDAMERLKDYETQVGQLKKKLLESLTGSPMPPRKSRQSKSSESRSDMNKEALIKELESFEHELDAVDEELAAVKASANALRTQVRTTNDEFSDYRSDAEDRERELRSYVEYMEQKDILSTGILELLLQRTDVLQSEVDRYKKQEGAPTLTAGDSEKQAKLENLEKLLAETQKKTELLEKQIKEGLPSIGRPMLSENERKRLREIDLLREQLEEKDEILEDQEGQLRDMKSRLERARKMNEAMKTLIDKEPSEQMSVEKSVENKQATLEIAGYRKELECTRKELAIVQQKLTQIERVREKLLIENKDLQEELKLREDSLFDQDDELEKRNAELAKLKRTLEQMKSELEESKAELSKVKTQDSGGYSSKLSAQIADNEKLREELSEKVRRLGEISAKLTALESREKETSERCERLSRELTVKESDLRERDVLLLEAKKESQKLADELDNMRKQDGERQNRVQQLEKTVNELNKKLQDREKETTHLQPAVTSVEASPALSRSPGWRTDSSPDSGIYGSDVGGGGGGRGSRDNTLSRRAELDRLRREVTVLREERDELARKARKDRQEFERRLAEVSGGRKSSLSGTSAASSGKSTTIGAGDLYSRAIAERQMTSKLSLLNEHTSRQNRVIMEMKIQNESLQNKMLEYQRRYVNLKEQYDAEQDAWLAERVVLESKAKEMRLPPVPQEEEKGKSAQQEDRKGVIMNTRKSLQEACIKLAEAEKEYERERQRLASEIERLENERAELKVQLAHFKDQQKMPKVLQRFGGTSSRSGQLPQLSASVTSAANSEAARRLEAAERTIAKLRAELQSKTDNFSQMSVAAVKEAEAARKSAEQQMEAIKEQVVQLAFHREQAELFRERLIEAERVAEREYKVWSDEREDLLYRIEDARICVEQWCLRLHHRENNELQTSDELVDEVVTEMERWRSSKLKAVSIPRRASVDSCASDGLLSPSMTESQTTGEMPMNPLTLSRGYSTLASNQRSTSMEWFNRAGSTGAHGQRGSTASLVANFGMSPALLRSSGGGQQAFARCGRSVSPDVSIRKVSNYPDPTPGFLIRPSSRQGSIDSLSSIGDATQKPFSMPGKPPLRQPISSARRKFFDETTGPVTQEPETPPPAAAPTPEAEPVSKSESSSLPNPTIVNIAQEQKTRATSEKESPTPKSPKTKTLKVTGGEPSPAAEGDKSPSMMSRLSSKFGGGGSGKSADSKSPPPRKAEVTEKKTGKPSVAKAAPPTTIKKMQETASVAAATATATSSPASSSSSKSPRGQKQHSEAPSGTTAASKQSETPEFVGVTLKKTPVSTGTGTTTTTRSTRSNSVGIAPSIMLLRQKFSGK